MKRYYYVALLALVMLLGMQALYIESLYKGYRNARIAAISDSLSIAVDDELHYRNRVAAGKQPEKRHTLQYKFAEDMTPAELDSLKRIKTDTIVLDAARNSRIGQTSADIIAQLQQDMALKVGRPLQLSTLDSIFGGMMKGAVAYRLSLLDKEKEATATAGTLEGGADWVYPLRPIGTKGLQYVQLEVQIPVWGFIASHVLVMAISLLLMLTVLGCVLYQLVVIRRKDWLLKRREQTINGTIHDLKSPLGTVVTMLSYLRKREADADKAMWLEQCSGQVNRTLCDIEGLLVTVRKDRNRLVLRKEETDVSALVRNVKKDMDVLFADKPHEIVVEDGLPEGFRVSADRMYLENVIRNLTENALKYADPGVRVRIALSAAQGNTLRVSVKDNGWGFAPWYRKRVFEQFFRVPRDGEKACRGYGIGLAQCRYIVEEHRGRIGVESAEGKGSEFWFTLPVLEN